MSRTPPTWAKTLVYCSTCFLLGVLFGSWVYDYPILWINNVSLDAVKAAEEHYITLSQVPHVIQMVFIIVLILDVSG